MDTIAKDLEDVKFSFQIKKATYGPEDASKGEPVDVTEKCQEAFTSGTILVTGGIHTLVGDPFEGVPKIFKAWLLDANKPDFECEDFETIKFEENKTVAYATYGIEGEARDVTAQIKTLASENQGKAMTGGIHHLLKEPLPSDPNKFKLWYQ